jgi:hypothetical protein
LVGCSSFASFGFERWLPEYSEQAVGLANVVQCGWGFFLLLLLGGGEKNKINFH